MEVKRQKKYIYILIFFKADKIMTKKISRKKEI